MNKKPTLRKRIGLELFRRLKKNNVILHEMHALFWECTLRCNLASQHCGSDCKVSAKHADMPLGDFLHVIDELTPYVNPNKVLIIFSGGEVLLRPDIEQCGRELYQQGYPWGMVSNGLTFSERLEGLLASGMRAATISLDGFEKAHNRLRCHPQSFKKAIRSIQGLIKTTGVNWDVVTCANQPNVDVLPL